MVSAPDWIDPEDTRDLLDAIKQPTGLETLGTADEPVPDEETPASEATGNDALCLIAECQRKRLPGRPFCGLCEHDVEGADRPADHPEKGTFEPPPSVCSLGVVDRQADTQRAVRKPGVYKVSESIVRLVQTATRARLRQHPEELNVHGEELPANHGELEVKVADILKGMLRDRGAA